MLFRILGGCALIIVAIWDAVDSLRQLKAARAKSEATQAGGRAWKWRDLIFPPTTVILAIILFGNWLDNIAARVVLGIASGLLLISRVSSDLKSWLRSRQERKRSRPPAEHAWFLTRIENGPSAQRIAAVAEGWESLQDRKAKLDKRVADGQITSDTAARYLAAHRRLLIEGLGYNRPSLWLERMLVSALLPLLSRARPSPDALTPTGRPYDEQARTG